MSMQRLTIKEGAIQILARANGAINARIHGARFSKKAARVQIVSVRLLRNARHLATL